jgi:3-isopropylmalate/(R)-2-methylmalate dehydratase small subunit
VKIDGTAWTFGDNINTDLIFPNHYFKPAYAPGEMGQVLLTGADPDFPAKVGRGDVIVGGRNFGCGSSREEAAGAMKEAGVGAIVATSFGRLFFRNCINLGVPVVTSVGIGDQVKAGDRLRIDLVEGTIEDQTNGYSTRFPAIAPELLSLLQEGGLHEYTVKELARRGAGAQPPGSAASGHAEAATSAKE